MNLEVTIAPSSIASLKAAIAADLQQPTLTANLPVRAVAAEIIDGHYAKLIDSIVDVRGDDIADKMVERISASDVAGQIDLGDLSNEISVRDLAAEINVDAQDVADHIDMRELAQHLDIDTDEIAENVSGNIDLSEIARHVADEIDFDTLAEALNTKALAREVVGQFINNEEFRRAFFDHILSMMRESNASK